MHLPSRLLALLIGLLPAALPAQQTNPVPPQESIKIDFGDKPAPASVDAPPNVTQPTPNPGPTPPSDALPLGFSANFVGQGPLEGIPFIWSGPLKAWRSSAPYTNASGNKPSDAEVGQLAATLRSDGLLLPQFLLRLDDQQHLLIATTPPSPPPGGSGKRGNAPATVIARGGFPSWRFGWKDSAKGWVSDRQLRVQFESEKDRDRDIRTWINQSNFPKGSSFYIDSDNRVVVTPP